MVTARRTEENACFEAVLQQAKIRATSQVNDLFGDVTQNLRFLVLFIKTTTKKSFPLIDLSYRI